MDGTALDSEAALAVEEARLARAAAAGDGSAFAALYERYEQRIFNFAYRVLGSEADAADALQEAFLDAMRKLPGEDDGELDFGTHLFTATHNACHRLLGRAERVSPGATAPDSPQEKIREASMQLPERQREVLALRGLEELSYEEIATIMELTPHSVAELIRRARINLDDELGGTVLASVAAPSPECERALPLIAAREDGQLEAGSPEAAWLGAHLADCDRCGLAVEAMREAVASYRTWAPIAAIPWLLGETMAKAAELAGADWSEAIAEAAAGRTPAGSLPGTPPAYRNGTDPDKSPRRHLTLAGGLAALLLLAGVAAILIAGDDRPPAVSPAAGTATGPRIDALEPGTKPGEAGKPEGDDAKKAKKKTAAKSGAAGVETTADETSAAPLPTPVPTGGGGEPPPNPDRPPAKTAVQPTQQPSGSNSGPKPKPAPTRTAAPPPEPAPAPVVEEPPPAEEPTDEPPRRREPPGKPADRPPR